MGHATLDRVLAVLVVSMAATGLVSLRAGAADAAWVFTLHAVLGGSLLAATVVKLRRSVPKAARAGRWSRLAFALLVSLGVVGALTGGFLWVASGELLTVGSWTVLTLHAWVGLAVVPLVIVHLLPRRCRVLRVPRERGVSRRTLLAAAGLSLAGVGMFGIASLVDRLRGGERRFTGSRWLPTGGIPPVTTFFGEGTPSIDLDSWRLTVTTPTSTRAWTLDALRGLGETEISAVLDCTSGWAIETGWRGVPLAVVLDAAVGTAAAGGTVGDGVDGAADTIVGTAAAGGTVGDGAVGGAVDGAADTVVAAVVGANTGSGGVRVTSVTGWTATLTLDEARGAFLATGVGGHDLPTGNGAPCRLVVPDHRGLDWVKWVTEVRVV